MHSLSMSPTILVTRGSGLTELSVVETLLKLL